jgi:hypothetical protein
VINRVFEMDFDQFSLTLLKMSHAPLLSYQGTIQTVGVLPPDVGGSVSDSHLLSSTNQGFNALLKVGTSYQNKTPSQFWSGVTITQPFDPRSIYDYSYQRWISITANARRSASSSVLVSISSNMNPFSSSVYFSIPADPAGLVWADYPRVGLNSKYIVVTTNLFNVSNDAYARGEIYVFNKLQVFQNNNFTFQRIAVTQVAGICPSYSHDNLEEYFLISSATGAIIVSKFSGEVGSLTVNILFSIIGGVVPWSSTGPDGPQLGSLSLIDSGDDRIQNVVQRGGTIWFCQTIFLPVITPVRSSVQWWQVSNNGILLQRNIIDNPSNFYSYPNISVNKYNDAVIVYSQFNSSIYPSILYSYRHHTDPVNTFRDPYLIKSGESVYTSGRWGDYFSSTVNPSDDQSFWIQGQYSQNCNCVFNWATWWAKIINLNNKSLIPSDFFRQGMTQIGVFNALTGNWSFMGYPSYNWGISTDILLNAKVYSGANSSLISWRNGTFYINNVLTQNNGYTVFNWGLPGDYPLAGDIDGDGIDKLCVFRSGLWFFTDINNQNNRTYSFGLPTDVPMFGDVLNVKRKQLIVWRPTEARFYFIDPKTSIQGSFLYGIPYPVSNDIPLIGDFMGLGYDQFGIFRSSTGTFYIQNYLNSIYFSVQFGAAGDIPLEGSFDGTGTVNIAVYRRSQSVLYVRNYGNFVFGSPTSIPTAGMNVFYRMRKLNLI